MAYETDNRIVMTLDAGGTNFVFSAIRANKEIVEPYKLPACGNNLEKSLQNIIKGFNYVKSKLLTQPVAISFSFPGPADYPGGIIGELVNLPAYHNIPLGPMLEHVFSVPVYINNDGDLFAYGEALAGYLPFLNSRLEKCSSNKRYKNLVGLTLGTGFGGGLVSNNELFVGDNSAALEVCNIRSRLFHGFSAEEGISIRAVKRMYAQLAEIAFDASPEPSDVYKIGCGELDGNKDAALESWHIFGVNLGDAVATLLTLVDGIAVIGGGVAGAKSLFWKSMVSEMKKEFDLPDGEKARRLETKVFDLEDTKQFDAFLKGEMHSIQVPFSDKSVEFDPLQRVGVALAKNDASTAIAIGAYAFALHQLDRNT